MMCLFWAQSTCLHDQKHCHIGCQSCHFNISLSSSPLSPPSSPTLFYRLALNYTSALNLPFLLFHFPFPFSVAAAAVGDPIRCYRINGSRCNEAGLPSQQAGTVTRGEAWWQWACFRLRVSRAVVWNPILYVVCFLLVKPNIICALFFFVPDYFGWHGNVL